MTCNLYPLPLGDYGVPAELRRNVIIRIIPIIADEIQEPVVPSKRKMSIKPEPDIKSKQPDTYGPPSKMWFRKKTENQFGSYYMRFPLASAAFIEGDKIIPVKSNVSMETLEYEVSNEKKSYIAFQATGVDLVQAQIGDRDDILTVTSHRVVGKPQAQNLCAALGWGNLSLQVPYIDIKGYDKSITFYLDFMVIEKDIIKAYKIKLDKKKDTNNSDFCTNESIENTNDNNCINNNAIVRLGYISISVLKINKKSLIIDFNDDIKNSKFSVEFIELVLKVPIDCIEKALARRNAIKAGNIFKCIYMTIYI
jgi:hypothetical protein